MCAKNELNISHTVNKACVEKGPHPGSTERLGTWRAQLGSNEAQSKGELTDQALPVTVRVTHCALLNQ